MAAYFSEISYGDSISKDFIEIAVPAGTDVSALTVTMYDSAGAVRGSYSLGDIVTTVAGSDVYVINASSPSFSNLRATDGLALSDGSGTVLQFVSFEGTVISPATGPAAGLSSTDLGSSGGNNTSFETSDRGATYAAQSSPNEGTIACYAAGMLIETPTGPRPVETLRCGDLVMTVDHGPQPIRWTRRSEQALDGSGEKAKPILIQAGALGVNCPSKDLIVSSQHRIVVGTAGQLTRFFDTMLFAPAKSLTGLPGVRRMHGKAKITWIHFACDRHEVITVNGCLSESLLIGPMVLNALTPEECGKVFEIFGPVSQQDTALNGPAAASCLKVAEVRRKLAIGAPKCRDDAA